MKNLTWNIYTYDNDRDSIIIYNIFEHESFSKDIEDIYSNTKEDFNKFKTQVKKYLYKNFYGNHVTNPKWKIFILPEDYKYDVHVVDVYGQLTLNEDIFMNYIWNNYKENSI